MIATSKIEMDLNWYSRPKIEAIQDDKYSRNVEISMTTDGTPWEIPHGARAIVRYVKSDGTGGEYDTMPNGETAWSASGNVLTIKLAPQVLTVTGTVVFTVMLILGEAEISTFNITINVRRLPGFSASSEDYINMRTWLVSELKAAMAAAKESGEFDGITPHIGANGNWWAGDTDTGIRAQGPQGATGATGKVGPAGRDGVSVTHSWDGTVLTVASASGASSADLKGEKGDPGKDGKDGDSAFYPEVFEATEQAQFTNMLDTAPLEYGKILNNDGTVSDTGAALCVTGYIPIKKGQVIRMKDLALYAGGSCSVCLYGADYDFKARTMYDVYAAGNYFVGDSVQDENGNFVQFTVLNPGSLAFIRICTNTVTIGKKPVITVDEEIRYKFGYGEKLNPKIKVDYSQITNPPEKKWKNGWNILPHERLNIAYSSIGRKPINTVEHFTDAAENYGYNALKADVRPTSDGELICCHDAGFTFDSAGKIATYNSSNATAIHDVTAATVLGYSFPTGEHPCLVSDYLDVCRTYGKIAFVTIRNEYMDVVIPKLLAELKAHNMMHSTIINCMTYESLAKWRNFDNEVMLNYTLNFEVPIDSAQIDRAVALGYCSLCGFSLNSASTTPSASCDFEYARANDIRLLQAIAYKEGSPEACYKLGYDGCQIGYPWG